MKSSDSSSVDEELIYLRGKVNELERQLKAKSELLIRVYKQLPLKKLNLIAQKDYALEISWLDLGLSEIPEGPDFTNSDVETSIQELWQKLGHIEATNENPYPSSEQ